eukprot:Plantae.Rhodophyta-Purpureofilum_apyrenoidigerum.ctg5750.p1 GENE.Plantae.Rhodophyta-Purpureofilum_apyrenoidigerum.ctg5750~~Plantae.Rhodophyta-Purpureofilum_apyrenoidigerum.ctg5750.p1  ORF type:complete len:644 (+),score=101.53 Plantae.Rhodophyta-Purpureofilum_apyrenoidigerum.ctg5750:188-1933(+)
MASLFCAGMDFPSQQWILYRDAAEAFVDAKALESAVAVSFADTDREPAKGVSLNSGGCSTSPLMVMDRERENYVLGKMYSGDPLGCVLGFGKPIDQRFHMRMGRIAPEIIMSSRFEGGYFMFRKIVLNLNNVPKEDAAVVVVHESDLQKVLVTVIIKVADTAATCICGLKPCMCTNALRSIEEVSNFYQVLRKQKLRSPWSVFTDLMKVMPTLTTVKDLDAFAMVNGRMSPICSRKVTSDLNVVRNDADLEALKYMYVQDLVERLTIRKPVQSRQIPAEVEDVVPISNLNEDTNDAGGVDTIGFGAAEPYDEIVGLAMPRATVGFDPVPNQALNPNLDYADMAEQTNPNTPMYPFIEELADNVTQPSSLLQEDGLMPYSEKAVVPSGEKQCPPSIGSPVDDESSSKIDNLQSSDRDESPQSDEERDLLLLGSPVDDDAEANQAEGRPTCEYCGATFKRKYEMRRHTKSIHLKEKRHTCDVCGKQFFQRSHMTIHMQTVHERRKEEECPECGRSFATKYKVDRHYRAVHLHERTYKCEFCGGDYYQNSDLKRHMKLQHADASDAQSSFSPSSLSSVIQSQKS